MNFHFFRILCSFVTQTGTCCCSENFSSVIICWWKPASPDAWLDKKQLCREKATTMAHQRAEAKR
ncbi:MAG: hypothetical protein DBY17_03970 [Oscillospiraceae bacterium]|nr:MAG: hypothetical protein DBY17_03970 [Oscillospiraceae bacterium]